MQNYTLRFKQKGLLGKLRIFDRKFKNVKNHIVPDDMNASSDHVKITVMNPNGTTEDIIRIIRPESVKFLLIIFEDESKEVVNLSEYSGYFISREWFLKEEKKSKQESQGLAQIKN